MASVQMLVVHLSSSTFHILAGSLFSRCMMDEAGNSRYLIVGVASGILFGGEDGLVNANPLAQRLYAA